MPDNLEDWIERLNEMLTEIDGDTVSQARSGNSTAQAIIQAWAVEAQAAAVFLATYTGAMRADVEAMVETANTIIDTVQAILLALGIAYLLKRLRKRERGAAIEIVISEREARGELGDRVKPIPSREDQDRTKENAFLLMRILWTTHFLLTVMQGLQMQEELDTGSDRELTWKAKLDANTCAICAFMHNKKSVDGDFLPVILKQFPNYRVFGAVMMWPHAHPRCRCKAVIE